MRRFINSTLRLASIRAITLPWSTSLPKMEQEEWNKLGKAVVDVALASDTGLIAFEECYNAREQLESIIQSIGYDMNVYIFGGLVTMGLLEVGGDVDFVAVCDIEPDFQEASEICVRISRELRRYGLKTWALPKARVPVIKADRVSKFLPGTPMNMLSCNGVFQFAQPLTANNIQSFNTRLRDHYNALELEWNSSNQYVTIKFDSTNSLMHALTQIKRHGDVELPLRVPVDIHNGPEIFRFPFDLCFSSTGLRNSYLFADALMSCPFARHLLLVLKKWGRSSGIINSIDGLLASYALTVMLVHFLIQAGKINKLSTIQGLDEPQLLAVNPQYRSLDLPEQCPFHEIGYLFAAFLEYYASIFDYEHNVVCTTNTNLTKKSMRWDVEPEHARGKPPFFEFAIKDPYGLDNIARNLDYNSVMFVKETHAYGLKQLLNQFNNPVEAINELIQHPHIPERQMRTLNERGIVSEYLTPEQMEARHALSKLKFYERKKKMENFGKNAARNSENQSVVTNVTRNVLGWIKSDETATETDLVANNNSNSISHNKLFKEEDKSENDSNVKEYRELFQEKKKWLCELPNLPINYNY